MKWRLGHWLWQGVKWIAKGLLKTFQWAWDKPYPALIVGVSALGIGWLASILGRDTVGGYLSSFGWAVIGVASFSAALSPTWAEPAGDLATWWARIKESFWRGDFVLE